jgi:hypothetical protein
MKIRLRAWEWIYAFMWCLLLLGATFPCILLDYDFSFLLGDLEDTSMYGISKVYMFAIVMVIIIHLLDVSHVVITSQITESKVRKGFLNTLFSLIIISLSLIFMASVDSYYVKIFWFILFWICLFIYKALCIRMTKNPDIKLYEFLSV